MASVCTLLPKKPLGQPTGPYHTHLYSLGCPAEWLSIWSHLIELGSDYLFVLDIYAQIWCMYLYLENPFSDV